MVIPKGYKQAEIGVIPEEWKAVKIGEIATVCMCKRIFANQTEEIGGIPFFKIGTFGKEPDAYISRTLYNEYKTRFSYPDKGDVLLSAAGTLGRTVVFDGKDAYFQDSNIVWLKINKEMLCNEYLAHYYRVIRWASSEGSTISRLYNGIICNTFIACPSIAEQKKIAKALSNVDDLISALEKKIAKYAAIKQACLQNLFPRKGETEPRMRLPGFTGAWVQRKLVDVLISLQNNTLSRADLSSEQGVALNVHYGDVLIKFGEYLDIRKEALPMIIDSSIVAKYKASFLQNGDVILADTAEDETVGKCSEIAGLTDETVISGLHTIPYRPLFKFASGYLGYYMNSNSYHHQLLPLMQGIKVTSISKSAMQNTVVCYPKSEDEQAEISGFFRHIDNLITLHQRKLEKYKNIKQGMMQQLLTGKIRLT